MMLERTRAVLKRADFWMVVATGLAAIAAIFSAIAAFRQERATFDSALYAKQVDELANFSGTVGRIVRDQLKDESAPLSSQTLTEYMIAERRVMLIFPKEVGQLVKKIQVDIQNLKPSADKAIGILALDGLDQALDECAHDQLSLGHNLAGPAFQTCVGEVVSLPRSQPPPKAR
jgi:hypothetical protein